MGPGSAQPGVCALIIMMLLQGALGMETPTPPQGARLSSHLKESGCERRALSRSSDCNHDNSLSISTRRPPPMMMMRGETCGKHGQGKNPLSGPMLASVCVGALVPTGEDGRHRVAAEASVACCSGVEGARRRWVGCFKPHSGLFPPDGRVCTPWASCRNSPRARRLRAMKGRAEKSRVGCHKAQPPLRPVPARTQGSKVSS